jgi:hypothetical protein
MNFIANYPIKDLTPASYNPREITEQGFTKLQESIKKFGIVKPVIINGADGTLTAGHQRTKALKAIGITHVPAMRLPSIGRHDEINFNLQHNRIEENKSVVMVQNAKELPWGFSVISHKDYKVEITDNAAIIQTIAKMIARYGDWGSCVIDENGLVIENAEYAVAAKATHRQLLVYKMQNSLIPEFKQYMRQDYGEYKYEKLGIKPYNQTHCQMHRLTGGRQNSSTTYENLVLPNLEKGKRLVDFGAGEQAYVKLLQQKGYKAFAYEPHPRIQGKIAFDIPLVVKMIRELAKDVKANGLYDYVVLDSVINSITTIEFQHLVMLACNALCKKNGIFFIGTRAMEKITKQENVKIATSTHRYVEYFDKNLFTATFRMGVWTLQKMHTKESFIEMLQTYFEEVTVTKKYGSSMHHAICRKPKQFSSEEYRKALDIEFNMEYPNGYRHNQQKELVNELLYALHQRSQDNS